jgi:hypothetical protein
MMAERVDWTATLGRAYAYQSTDVMLAVQRMRALAAEHGNLVSNEQQQVVHEDDNYLIVPAQPQVIYVPVYDPWYVYSRPIFGLSYSSRFWSFGIGYPIGSWLIYDFDWRLRNLYYHGWDRAFFGWGGGWRARSWPFIQVTNVYVHPRHRNVYVNPYVHRRVIDYARVDRGARVHRDVSFVERNTARNTQERIAREARNREAERAVERARIARIDGSSDRRAARAGSAVERVERVREQSIGQSVDRAGRSGSQSITGSDGTPRRIGELPTVTRSGRIERATTARSAPTPVPAQTSRQPQVIRRVPSDPRVVSPSVRTPQRSNTPARVSTPQRSTPPAARPSTPARKVVPPRPAPTQAKPATPSRAGSSAPSTPTRRSVPSRSTGTP